MDNTILRSKIDLRAMREELIQLLLHLNIGKPVDFEGLHTAAQVIEYGKLCRKPDPELDLETLMWDIVKKHETIGMADAKLELGALEVVQELKKRGFLLTVVTNNAEASTHLALQQSNLISFFDLVVTRDQMSALKPSPAGVELVLEQFSPEVSWYFVGDSWIDGEAAQSAGVPFIAYQGEPEDFQKHGIKCIAEINDLSALLDIIGT